MSDNWEVYTLREISRGKGQYGIAAPGIPYDPNLTRYLRITDITDDGFLIKDNKVSVDVNSEQYEKYILKKNDIVFARTGASAGRSYVYEEEAEPLIVAGFLIRYALNPEIVNPRFMRYYTISSNYKGWVAGVATGSTRPNINEKMLSSMEVKLPPLSEQNRIVQILDSLEHKLKNNNAIIANLEEQAQAIFKSWFVDFEPFQDGEFIESELGRIPNNWTVVTLKEISEEIVTGKTPPTKDPENYGNKMPFVTIPDMHNNVYAIETERLLSDKGIDTQSNKVVPKNSISVSCIATVGLVTLIASDSMTNQQINTVITKENISSYYVYNHLKTQSDYLNAIGSSGSTTKNVNKTTFSNLKMLLPSESILKKYHRLCEPIFEYILLIQKQNKKLVETRDTLLPKLMSGEIRVEEAIEVEEV